MTDENDSHTNREQLMARMHQGRSSGHGLQLGMVMYAMEGGKVVRRAAWPEGKTLRIKPEDARSGAALSDTVSRAHVTEEDVEEKWAPEMADLIASDWTVIS